MRHSLSGLGFSVIKEYIVHQNVCQHILLQHLLPKVGCLVTVRVNRVSCSLSVRQAFVERHKVGLFAVKTSSEVYLIFIQSKVRQAASELKDSLFRVALRRAVLVFAVLACGLMCPRVLQFEGEQRNTVEVQHKIQFKSRVIDREGLLPCEGELVASVETMTLRTICRRRFRVEKGQMDIIHVESVTENIYHTTVLNGFAQLVLYTLGEVAPFVVHQCLGLGGVDE